MIYLQHGARLNLIFHSLSHPKPNLQNFTITPTDTSCRKSGGNLTCQDCTFAENFIFVPYPSNVIDSFIAVQVS